MLHEGKLSSLRSGRSDPGQNDPRPSSEQASWTGFTNRELLATCQVECLVTQLRTSRESVENRDTNQHILLL